jgi:hypothetical protein
MNILKLIAAVLAAVVAGSLVNMGLVTIGPRMIPLPEGIDPSDMESFKASAHLLEAKHYVFPFLAHALGTLAGALIGYLLAPRARRAVAWGMGFFFLAGGIAASFMIPAPGTFIAIDLILAYLPMAWLAIRVGGKIRRD